MQAPVISRLGFSARAGLLSWACGLLCMGESPEDKSGEQREGLPLYLSGQCFAFCCLEQLATQTSEFLLSMDVLCKDIYEVWWWRGHIARVQVHEWMLNIKCLHCVEGGDQEVTSSVHFLICHISGMIQFVDRSVCKCAPCWTWGRYC
jgi:hypothetical protein